MQSINYHEHVLTEISKECLTLHKEIEQRKVRLDELSRAYDKRFSKIQEAKKQGKTEF